MRAIEANPSLMVELIMDELCTDCPLRSEFDEGNVFVSLDTKGATTSVADFNISDKNKRVWYVANGVVRRENIIEAFDGCVNAVKSDSIDSPVFSCGALIKLHGKKREINGREGI